MKKIDLKISMILIFLIILISGCTHSYKNKEDIYPIDSNYKVKEFIRLSFEDGTLEEDMCYGCGGHDSAKISKINDYYSVSWPCMFCKFNCSLLVYSDGDINKKCP